MTEVELHLSHAQWLQVERLVQERDEEMGAGSAMMIFRFPHFPTDAALMEIENDDLPPL